MQIADWNLLAGWAGMALGVLGGIALGLGFAREDWMGGYGSWPRRLLRLGHISLFGLGILNVLFFACCVLRGWHGGGIGVASAGFVVAAVAMPLCCCLCAWRPRLTSLFAVPVMSLLVATVLVAREVWTS